MGVPEVIQGGHLRQRKFFSQDLGQLRPTDGDAFAYFDLSDKARNCPIGPVRNRRRKQVWRGKNGGEIFRAVAEIVLKVISLRLEDVEGLILDFPPGTSAVRKLCGKSGAVHIEIRREAVAVRELTHGIGDLDLELIDHQGILAIAQRNTVDPAVAVGETPVILNMPRSRHIENCQPRLFAFDRMQRRAYAVHNSPKVYRLFYEAIACH